MRQFVVVWANRLSGESATGSPLTHFMPWSRSIPPFPRNVISYK